MVVLIVYPLSAGGKRLVFVKTIHFNKSLMLNYIFFPPIEGT